MSKTVDNRVVELGFDNKQFENGAKTSISTLDTLKKSLNLDETSKSLLNLSNAGKSFTLAGMAENIQNISSKFSALGVIGFTVLQNLTNSAINFGKKIFQSLTTPIKTGLKEYETQINAIQTVLANTASKGTTLEQVNDSLDQLNTYADKTIYNFTEMTKNIGTFTAAGVDLETSVESIKGIANLAAVSGSNSQQAATAMYQLSQAISSGTVRLMDWNSVVNAGMGGQVFQDALKETARVNGIAVDEMIAKNGSFRESLQEGWLSSEILTQTLAKFTGDLNEEQLKSIGYTEEQIAGIIKLGQTANDAATKVKTLTQLKETIQESLISGWAQSWRIIIGDFEEAKSFFTEVSETIGPMIQASSDARNKILQEWANLGGREDIIQALRNTFQGLLSVIKPISEAFKEIFPPITGVHLANLTRLLKELTEKFKISGEAAEKIKMIFKGLFSIFDIIRMGVSALVESFISLLSPMKKPSGSSILTFLSNIASYLVYFRDLIKTNNLFIVGLKNIGTTIGDFSLKFINFLKKIGNRFKPLKITFSNIFKDVDFSGLKEFFSSFKLLKTDNSLKVLEDSINNIKNNLLKVIEKINPIFKSLEKSFFKFIDGIVSSIQNLVKGGSKITEGISKPFENFGGVIDKIKETFKSLEGSKIGEFINNISSSIVEAFSNLDFGKVFAIISGGLIGSLILTIRKFISGGTDVLGGVSKILGGITGVLDGVRGSLEAWQQNLKAKTLLTIASAIGILTVSLIALSLIDQKKLGSAIAAVTALFINLMGAMAVYSKVSGMGGATSGLGLVALSVSVLIIASALYKLAQLDAVQIQNGITGIIALTVGLSALSLAMSKSSGSIAKGSIGLFIVSIALLSLSKAIEKMGNLDYNVMSQGLKGIGIILFELAAFMKLVNFDKMGVTKGLGLLVLVASIMALSLAVERFGKMDTEVLTKGLIAIGAVLMEFGLFTKLASGTKGLISTAIGLTILSATMMVIGKTIESLGKLQWEEIGKGLAALGGSLLILGVALYFMQGTLGGSLALLVAVAAINLLVPALQVLGSLELNQIGIALLAIAGVFLVIGLAGLLLTPVVPVLLGFGAALVLIGAASLLVGIGLLAFSIGLSAIAVSGGIAALVIVGMVTTIVKVIPIIAQALVDALMIFGKGIITATPIIKEAIQGVLDAFLDIIIKTTPKIFKALSILLTELIGLIRDKVPDFIDAILYLIGELLTKIAENIPKFVQAGFDILIGFLKGVRDNIAEVVVVVAEIITEFLDAVALKLPDIIDSGWNLIISFINGMADSVDKNMQPLLDAIGRLATNIISGLVTGITKGAAAVLKALKDIVDAAILAIKRKLGIASPSKLFAKIGTFIPLGLIIGIEKLKEKVIYAMENLANAAIDGMSKSISKVNDILTNDLNINPTITPVMDLTELISGKKAMDKLVNSKTFNIVPTVYTMPSISSNLPSNDSGNLVTTKGSVISLTQNNYSPVALSRFEIYRQTKIQLLTLKGLVE